MSVDLQLARLRLEANAHVFESLLKHVGEEQARWKPAPEHWSILEVVNHLADEERDDFRTRLDLTLHQPETDWPPIDPRGWAVKRDYNSRELQSSLAQFLSERRQSLEFLRGLETPDWTRAHVHPQHGPISAGDLLTGWLGHDLLHIRQITRRHWEWLAWQAAPFSTRYAGEW